MKKGGFSFKSKTKANKTQAKTEYFGCPDMDRIFDFRFPKSSLILVKENPLSNHSKCLSRYFVGYGVEKGLNVTIFDNEFERWGNLIPKKMQKKKIAELQKMRKNERSGDNKSSIAWRYDKMNITFDKSELRSDYTVLDLSKNVKRSEVSEEKFNFFGFSESENYDDFVENVVLSFENTLSDADDTSSKRLYIGNFLAYFQEEDTPGSFRGVLKFVKALKRLVRASYTTVVVKIDGDDDFKSEKEARAFDSFFDCVLNITPLHNNKLFSDFSATLTFERLNPIHKFMQYPIKHYNYGIKNYKSSLEIELLYENSISHTDDTNEDNQLLCRPGPSGENDLDF